MLLLTLTFGALIALLIADYFIKKHRVEMFAKSKITGPSTLPLLGCGLEAGRYGAEDLIQYIGECFQKYGSTFRMWIMSEAQVYTMDIKHFESILSSTTVLAKGDLYAFLRSWLKDGLLLSTGKKWHARRKVFTPAFHFKVLEHYVGVFDEQSAIMVEKLRASADGKRAIDMFGVVSLAALDVITEAAMGVKVNAQLDPEFPYVKALKSVVYIQPDRMLKFNQRTDWMFKLTAPLLYGKLINDIKTMHDFTIEVIELRRNALKQSIEDGTYKPLAAADAELGTKQQMNLLDILLQSTISGQALTNEDICEEVDTFMFEGDDTTTSGVSHALYSIARHARVQQKLFNELVTVIGNDKNAPITMAQLQELKYLECVIKETMRLYPPVPSIGRKTDKDIHINGMVLPANTSIYLVTYYAHRNPEYFSDPLSFIPERFEEHEAGEQRNPFAYTPFSAGPRNCIGQKFAMLEMKALISKMLRHYELLPLGPQVTPMLNFILRSPVGANVGLKPRVY